MAICENEKMKGLCAVMCVPAYVWCVGCTVRVCVVAVVCGAWYVWCVGGVGGVCGVRVVCGV